jgi:ATP-dependent Clp protease adaptor protein ClpS
MIMTATDVLLDEKIKITVSEPKKYKIVFLNDDKTPMDFVVSLLVELFKHTEEVARTITVRIHEEGSGVVGIYSYEIAEQKALEATGISRENGFPLKIKVEEDS